MNKQQKFHDNMLEEGLVRKNDGSRLLETDPDEIQIEQVKCEVCQEIIGKIDMGNFKPPLHGSMFFAKNEKNDYPPPFHSSLPWEDLRCPYCRKRPFYSRNYITNEKGIKIGLMQECHICDMGFVDWQSLAGHMNIHKKERVK